MTCQDVKRFAIMGGKAIKNVVSVRCASDTICSGSGNAAKVDPFQTLICLSGVHDEW
jgi:hypothetical protein